MTVILPEDSGVLFKHQDFVLIIASDPTREYTSVVVMGLMEGINFPE